ncbi:MULTISPECIES: hypothetical protein [Actinomyces]|nr:MULTISPECIES: hypothetical protein [Actinomyces]
MPARAVKVSRADRAVLGAFLPEAMVAMDPAGALTVVRMLRERSEAGWAPSQVRRLMDQPLPESVGRMSSLVASRLERNVPVDGAPVRAARLSDDELQAARQRRADALASHHRRQADPRFAAALERARAALGAGASRLEVAQEAHRLLDAQRAAGAGASP